MRNLTFFRPHKARTLAISATPATDSTAVTFGDYGIRLVASQDCWVSLGPNPVSAVGTGFFMPAGYVEYFSVGSGDRVAATIDGGAASQTGKLSITELTR